MCCGATSLRIGASPALRHSMRAPRMKAAARGWVKRAQPIWRRSSIPVLTGKYFWRFSSSSNGARIFLLWLLIQEPALRRPIRANLVIVRVPGYALRHGMGASRVEGAARGRLGEIGGAPGIA